MPRWRETFLLLPGAAFAVIAVLAAASGQTVLASGLGVLAAGVLLGTASAAVAMHASVARLHATAATITGDEGVRLPDARSFGLLAPMGRWLIEVADVLRHAREEANTDRLTLVASRPTLLDLLFTEVDRAIRHDRPFCIAFIDLDHFKAVNDTFGHEIGDIVLRGVARVFREQTRASDFIGRYGGEEFVLALPETSIADAAAVAEKLRVAVLRERFRSGQGDEVNVSVSIGVAGGTGANLRVDKLLRDADAAMYVAKSLGRNQTYVFAEPDDDAASIPRAPLTAEARRRAVEVGDRARQAAESVLADVLAPYAHYAGRPSPLIAEIAVQLATALKLPDAEVERIRVASLLHDVGKLAVPPQILEKPGPLDPAEWQRVVQHPRVGQLIIDRVAAVGAAGAIILHHHERYGGNGYPFGLHGSDIPIGARIVAIADAYDAMVRDRPYRRAIGHRAAIAELREHARIQFDPELVDLFCAMYADYPPLANDALRAEMEVADAFDHGDGLSGLAMA